MKRLAVYCGSSMGSEAWFGEVARALGEEMARRLLIDLGDSEDAAQHAIDMFRGFDENSLKRQQAIYRDQQQLVQTAQEIARELEQLFDEDRAASLAPPAAGGEGGQA